MTSRIEKHVTAHAFRVPTRWFVWYGTVLVVCMGATFIFQYIPGAEFVTFVLLGATIGCALTGGIFLIAAHHRFKSAARITHAFKESRDRYAHALESAKTGTWEWTVSGESAHIYVSERWREIYGHTEESAPKKLEEWTALVHPEDQGAFLHLVRHAIDTDTRAYKNEYRIRFGTSEDYRYVRDYGSIVTEGGVRKLIGSSHDETPIRIAEEVLKRRTNELREANARIKKEIQNTRKFQQAVESAHDAIAITDTEGTIIHANAAWYKLIGIKEEEIPKKFFEPFEKHTPSIQIRQLKKALKDTAPFVSDNFHSTRPNHKGEAYTAEISMSPVFDDGAVMFFAIIADDITQRKEIDRAKTEFVSLASHQLRTPLSAIRWYTEMLKEGIGGTITDTQKSYLEEVYTANLRMIDLVNSLLNVSRIDMGTVQSDPKKILMPHIIKDVIGELRPRIAHKKLSLREEYAPNIPEQWFDPRHMHMIFQNLLSNAVKYTPEGGSITIHIRLEGDNIFFSVSDSGIGIPKEQQPQIFNKLFRADNAREIDTTGTGLGLYIIKSIIEKAGGSLRFESKEGTGTTFYGILPIQKEKPSATKGTKALI